MKRGPIIHGILLVAALVFAYQTWTREETVEPLTGDIVVWSVPEAELQAITFKADGRWIRIERRSDETGPYLWGTDQRTIEQYLPKDPNAPDAAPDDKGVRKPVLASTTRDFMVGEKGDELFKHLAELRALRSLGKLDEDKRAQYELHDKTQTIAVHHGDETHELVLGGKVYGSGDRYALDPTTGEVYVVSEIVSRDLINGEAGLRLATLHAFKDDEVGKAIIEVKGQKRTLLRTTAVNERGRETKTWADAETPTKPNQTMANFLRNIDLLRPARFVADTDVSKLQRVVRVEYQTAEGAPLGWLELYHQPRQTPEGQGTPGSTAPGAAGAEAGKPGAPGAAGAEAGKPGAPGAAGAEAGKPGTVDKDGKVIPDPRAFSNEDEEDRRPQYVLRTELMRIPAGVVFTAASRITEDIDQIFGQ